MDQILKGLYRLGSPEFPAYLVAGSHRVVQVDAGPVFMGPVYLQDIPKVLGKGRGPDFLFQTHSHFDHVGSTPFLLRHFPEIKVGGSETFARRLSQTKTGKTITDLNRALVRKSNIEGAFISGDFGYSLLTVEQILKDGDFIDLGGGASLEV
jgi:2-aminobenzoylacetyl-CoA thioesterase